MSQIVQQVKTMSSLELVDVINNMREEGTAELRHDHFVAKIEGHPGIDAPKFSGTQKYGNNNKRKIYNLPKRECELMVMSESLAVQAKVYDRMVDLEAAPAPAVRIRRATASKLPVMVAAGMVPGLARALRALGISPNAAAIGANQIATKETGANLLALAGHQHLVTPTQQICYTPTELGSRFVQSAKAFNRRLADAGLQESIVGHWVPTEKGQPYAVVLDTGKAHGSGAPIQQVKWLDSVLGEVAL